MAANSSGGRPRAYCPADSPHHGIGDLVDLIDLLHLRSNAVRGGGRIREYNAKLYDVTTLLACV